MPDTAPPTAPSNMTSSFWTSNVRQQVVAQVLAASTGLGAEGRVWAVTDRDRLEFDNGSVLLPGPNWGAAGRVGFSLTDATNRSIPNGTGTHTAMTFSTEVTDTDGFFTAGGTTVTIPANRGGIYGGMAQTLWATSPGANSSIELSINGSVGWRQGIGAATQLLLCSISIAPIVFAAGDTLQIRLSQGSGGALNVNPSSWQMWRLAA